MPVIQSRSSHPTQQQCAAVPGSCVKLRIGPQPHRLVPTTASEAPTILARLLQLDHARHITLVLRISELWSQRLAAPESKGGVFTVADDLALVEPSQPRDHLLVAPQELPRLLVLMREVGFLDVILVFGLLPILKAESQGKAWSASECRVSDLRGWVRIPDPE